MGYRISPASVGQVHRAAEETKDALDEIYYEMKRLLRKQVTRFPHREYRGLLQDILEGISYCDGGKTTPEGEHGLAVLIERVHQAMEIFAPTYGWFGAHSETGHVGFWVSDPRAHEDILCVSDSSEVPRSHRGEYLVVNDHGNMTLMRKTSARREVKVWAVV